MKDPAERAGEEFGTNLTRLEHLRIGSLIELRTFEIAMRTFLQHETQRIKTKLGPQHPRVKRLNARLKSNLELVRTLETERQTYEVDVPEVSEDETLLHGRVVDEDRRGIRGLLVCIVDAKGDQIRGSKDASTDSNGYFAHTLDAELVDRIRREQPNGAFIGIFTGGGQPVHRGRKPLELDSGARLFVEVSLNRDEVAEKGRPGKPPGGEPPEPRVVFVPDVRSLPESEAVEKLKSVRLEVGQVATEPTRDQVGLVLSQDPAAGTKVAIGTPVHLVVGVAEKVVVPSVVDIKLSSARSKLRQHGLKLGTVKKRPSTMVDIVLEQDPKANEEVPLDTPVDVVVGEERESN